jgi:YHS domain-containing protein
MAQSIIPQNKPAQAACGGNLKNPESFQSSPFRGDRVYFCTHACQRAFESDPEGFMADEIEHPLEEE